MRYLSRKNMLSLALSVSTKTEILKGNKLLFFTSLGLVSGYVIDEPPSDATDQEKATHAIFSGIVKTASEHYAQLLSEDGVHPVPGDESILLQDVEVSDITRKNVISLPYLILFLDQIIGVTLAGPQNQQD